MTHIEGVNWFPAAVFDANEHWDTAAHARTTETLLDERSEFPPAVRTGPEHTRSTGLQSILSRADLLIPRSPTAEGT